MVVAVAAAAAPVAKQATPQVEESQDGGLYPDTEAFARFLEEATSSQGRRLIRDMGRIVGEYLSTGRVFGGRQWRAVGVNAPDRPFPPNINQMVRENELLIDIPPGVSFNQLIAIFKSRFKCADPFPPGPAFPETQIPTLTPGWHIITVKPKEAISIRQGTFSPPSCLVAAAGGWAAMELKRPLNFGGVRCSEQGSPVIIQDPQTRAIVYSKAVDQRNAAEESLLVGRYDETFQEWVPGSPLPGYDPAVAPGGEPATTWFEFFKSIEHLPYREFWRLLCLEAPQLAQSILTAVGKSEKDKPEESKSAIYARIEANPALLTNLSKPRQDRYYYYDNRVFYKDPLSFASYLKGDSRASRSELLGNFLQGSMTIRELRQRHPPAFLVIADLLWHVRGGTYDQSVRDLMQYPDLAQLVTQATIAHQIDCTEMTQQGTLIDRRPGIDLPPQHPLWIHDDDKNIKRDANTAAVMTQLLKRDRRRSPEYRSRDDYRSEYFSEYLKNCDFNKWVQLGAFLLNNPKFSHLLPFDQNMQVEQQEGVYLLKFSSIPFYNYTRAIRSISISKELAYEDFPRELKSFPTSVQAITKQDLDRSADRRVTVRIGKQTLLIKEPMILLTGLPKPRDKKVHIPARMSREQADTLANAAILAAPRGQQQQQPRYPETSEEILNRLFNGDWADSNWPEQTNRLTHRDLFAALQKKDPKRWIQLGTALLNTPRFAVRLQIDTKFCPKTIDGVFVIEGGFNLSYYEELLENLFLRFNLTDHLLDIRTEFEKVAQQTLVVSQHDLNSAAAKPLTVRVGEQSLQITEPSIILTSPPLAFEFAKRMELQSAPLSPPQQAAPLAKRPASAAAAAAAAKQPEPRPYMRYIKRLSASKAKAAAAAIAKRNTPLEDFLDELNTRSPRKYTLLQHYHELCKHNPYQYCCSSRKKVGR
jgi:hypothetical protein